MNFLFGGKQLRMAWKLDKGGPTSYLVATAHFFPHSFQGTFARRIREVDTVLFEGPLDPASMEKIREYGQQRTEGPSLADLLDPETVSSIDRKLSNTTSLCGMLGACLQVLRPARAAFVEETAGFRPWMAFFAIWSQYLKTRNWHQSTDMEAYRLTGELGKKIVFLETIQEQLHALDNVPLDGIAQFLGQMELWDGYTKRFVDLFMKGDLESMVSSTTRFPTRCPSIVADRDPVLFARMLPFIEKERTIALFGTIHIPGVKQRLIEAGWQVTQVTL
jgi:hypothetical protein